MKRKDWKKPSKCWSNFIPDCKGRNKAAFVHRSHNRRVEIGKSVVPIAGTLKKKVKGLKLQGLKGTLRWTVLWGKGMINTKDKQHGRDSEQYSEPWGLSWGLLPGFRDGDLIACS